MKAGGYTVTLLEEQNIVIFMHNSMIPSEILYCTVADHLGTAMQKFP